MTNWISPEVFAGVFGAGLGAAALLKKTGILELPLTRNSPAKTVHEARTMLPLCKVKFRKAFTRLDELETCRTEAVTERKAHEKRLDKGEEKFERIMKELATISAEVKFIASAERKRNGGGGS